mgnify:CR=1 FL=1
MTNPKYLLTDDNMSNPIPSTPWTKKDWSDATFAGVAEYMAQYLPEDRTVEATFENGSFTVLVWERGHIITPHMQLIDGEATPAEQLKVAFDFAMRHGAKVAA